MPVEYFSTSDEEDLNHFLQTCSTLIKLATKRFGFNNELDLIQVVNNEVNLMEEDGTKIGMQILICKLINCVNNEIIPRATEVNAICYLFDFQNVRANGFRSIFTVTERCIEKINGIIRHLDSANVLITKLRQSELYRDLTEFIFCLFEWSNILNYSNKLSKAILRSTDPKLFATPSADPVQLSLFIDMTLPENKQLDALLDSIEDLNQNVFFGRCLGFYYCKSSKNILLTLTALMTSFKLPSVKTAIQSPWLSLLKANLPNTLWSSATKFMRHLTDPDARAESMTHIIRYAPIEFCKEFYKLGDSSLANQSISLVIPRVKVGLNFSIPMYSLHLKEADVVIEPPKRHSTIDRVQMRLLCTHLRVGQGWTTKLDNPSSADLWPMFPHDSSQSSEDTSNQASFNLKQFLTGFMAKKPLPPSSNLLFHCHGGGFVGQSAQAHDVYLKFWAEKLNCPILSVNYSLAPEYPFPQAVEEAFYAYCWALKNALYLGTTAERIVFCGDSAGGSIILAVVQKAIAMGVRLPNGILPIYPSTFASFTPSPSRALSFLDPLLPVGILSRCLLAYAGIDETQLVEQFCTDMRKLHETEVPDIYLKRIETPFRILRSASMPRDPFMSSWLASKKVLKQFPPTVLVACHLDPLLDDSVELAKRLHQAGGKVTLRVINKISHGFLNFLLLSPECRDAANECCGILQDLMQGSDAGSV